MRLFLIFLTLLLPAYAICEPACKEAESWTPEIKFKLEDSSFGETLHWVSGWSYSLSAQIKAQKSSGISSQICACNDLVSSKFILDALNKEFGGKIITAEQASNFIWQAVQRQFNCASGR